jgi:hypothetical protein
MNDIKKLCAAVALVCALLAPHAVAAPATVVSSPAAYECEGNACSAVTLTLEEEGQQFRVDNNSDSRVKVDVTTYGGDSSIRVEPHKSDYLPVKYFNGPYRASFE